MIFVGNISELYKYYRVFDMMVLPSLYEGLSMAAIESQACECPVLASKAVPEEAVISNGCKSMRLEEPIDAWANEAVIISKIKVKLNEWANTYRIEIAVKDL